MLLFLQSKMRQMNALDDIAEVLLLPPVEKLRCRAPGGAAPLDHTTPREDIQASYNSWPRNSDIGRKLRRRHRLTFDRRDVDRCAEQEVADVRAEPFSIDGIGKLMQIARQRYPQIDDVIERHRLR